MKRFLAVLLRPRFLGMSSGVWVPRLDWTLGIEIISLAFTIMAALSSVMFLFRLFNYADYIVMSQQGLFSVLMFTVFLFPNIFKITVPVSLLLASCITVIRMAQDRELEAWFSSGVSILRLAVTPVTLGFLALIASLYMSLFGEAFARQEWRKFRWMHARKSIESLIETRLRPQTLTTDLLQTGSNEVLFYLGEISDNKKDFKDVNLIVRPQDARYSTVITARSGSLNKEMRDGVMDYVLSLREGHFYHPNVKNRLVPDAWSTGKFMELQVSLVNLFQRQFDPGAFDDDDMRSKYPLEYYAALKKLREKKEWQKDPTVIRDHTFFYEQIVVPFSCLLLPLVGLCLGLQDPRKRPGLVYTGLSVVIFTYYAAIMLCQQLARRSLVAPELTLWLPPVILVFVTLILLRWRWIYPPAVGFFEFVELEWCKYFGSKKSQKQMGEKI